MPDHPAHPELRIFRAEFHIHTVLSPCASIEMIPPLIVRQAEERGINILAISDHNATANIQAVMRAAEGSAITVLPGVELHTREEVHLLCLFANLPAAEAFQQVLDRTLPPGNNRPEVWGPQYVVDPTGEFLREEKRILSMATSLTIDEAVQAVHNLDGLVIPAHIQRSMYGILPTLGFLPEEIHFDALEVNVKVGTNQLSALHPSTQGYPILRNGDAHYLEDITGANRLLLGAPTLAEIRLALRNESGRMVLEQ